MTLRLDRGVACRQLELRGHRQHEFMLQRIIKGILPKEREVVKPLHSTVVERRNVGPAASASYAESRHIIVIRIENFLYRKPDVVSICIAASYPRRCEDIQLIRGRRVLSNDRFQKDVISHYSVCESSSGYHNNQYQSESADVSHASLPGRAHGRLRVARGHARVSVARRRRDATSQTLN